MSCVFISVLTDNIFYLISFESSAFRRGSNLFPLMYRIAEAKGFKSILKLLSKTTQKSWLILIFVCIYFCELKKIIFRECLSWRMANFWKFGEYLSLRMVSFWKFWVYKFQPQWKKNKQKKQLNQGTFGKCFCHDQRKDKQVTMEKLLLFIDSKKKLN